MDHGRFLKGVALGVDSAFIRSPFDSTITWYEGAFVKVEGMWVPMGTHRIYDEQGSLLMEVVYDYTRESSAIGSKRPLRINRRP